MGGATFTDQHAEVVYLGAIKTWNVPSGSNNLFEIPFNTSAPTTQAWQLTAGPMEWGWWTLRFCNTDGVIEWPDYIAHPHQSFYAPYWYLNGGASFMTTHHPTPERNNWTIRTGNGLIYHSHIESACPLNAGHIVIDPFCTGMDGLIWIWTSNAALMPTSLTINIWNNSGTLVETYTVTGQFSITKIFQLPIGNGYTYEISSPDCFGTFHYGAFDIVCCSPEVTFSFDPPNFTIVDPTTCSSNDGSVIASFSSANPTALTQPNNGKLIWTLYHEPSPGVYNYITHEHPFQSVANGGNATSNYPNGGLTGTGVSGGTGCAGIAPPASMCFQKQFDVANNLDDGCYRLVLSQDRPFPYVTSPAVFADPSTMSYADFMDDTGVTNGVWMACAETYDFCLTCPGVNITCSNIPPVCHQLDDEDQGNNGVWTGLATGYVGGAAPWQPTDVGSVTCTTNGLGIIDYVWTNSGGTVVSSTLGTTATIDTVTGLPPDPAGYTCTVTDAGGTVYTCITLMPAAFQMSFQTLPTITDATCNNNDGSIFAGGVGVGGCGGTVEYALSISNTAVWNTIIANEWVVEGLTAGVAATWQPGTLFTNLAPGTYYEWARNTCHCATVSSPLVVGSGTNLSATISNTASPCTGVAAILTVAVASGTAPYTYAWTTVTSGANGVAEPGFTAPPLTSNTYTQATIGDYDYAVVITDSQGCTLTLTYSTTSTGALNLSAIVSQIGCSGGTGSITATIAGGAANYTFVWTGAITVTDGPAATTSYTKTTLAAGTYNLTVTDANGCTASDVYTIASIAGQEEFIDLNHYEYNTVYGLTQTGTAYEDSWYGKYGGPTCPSSQCSSSPCDDGTIRIILDSTSPVGGAAFPYDVEISNTGGAPFYPVRSNGGTVYTGANGLTTTDAYDTGTGFLTSTGAVYDHLVDGMNPATYFELQGGTNGDEWNNGGWADLPFTAGSTWTIRLTETGTACTFEFTTTILPSDYQNVDVGGNVLTQVTQPTCCGCSSYGASNATNVCNGMIDITPTLGTYENHALLSANNVPYTYLWTYASLPTTCAIVGHINVNTMWANQTTQDIVSEWPGTYTIVVTDSCAGTDTEVIDLLDPIVYIDDITWTHPLCADCCDGTITITAHGGNGGALEVSVDNRNTWEPMTSNPYTYTGLCDGMFSVWVRDTSWCVNEYFADPDDAAYGGLFADECFADADITCTLTTSGTWTPTSNTSIMGTPTAAAFTGTGCTRIQLTAVSDFEAANPCVIHHNTFPGGTDGEITLDLVGGNAPYTITIVTLSGPVYNPTNPPMPPCQGIGPLSALPDPCLMTGLPLPITNLPSTSVITVTENTSGLLTQWAGVPVTGFITNDTTFTFEQVSVSRDLNSSALGAEYIFYVQDSTGCVQMGQVGVDNGMYNLISIYAAEDCDCICPLGYTLDTDPGSSTFEQCIRNVMEPVCFNGTHGYWDLCANQFPFGIVPSTWGILGGALYGVWSGGAVNYGAALSIPASTLPLKKNITAMTVNLLYEDNTTNPIIGVDLMAWNTTGLTSYINSRIPDIAIWMFQSYWPVNPPPAPLPDDCWIGCITDVNFPAPVDAIVCMSSNEKMRMTIDGVVHLYMDGDDTVPPTIASNEQHFNMFPIILPQGIHVIAFEVYNTSGAPPVDHAFMAFDVMSSTMSSGNLFVAECLAPGYTQVFHESNIITDIAGNPLSSKFWGSNNEEIQLGSCHIGYSCCTSTATVNMDTFCDSIYQVWLIQGSNAYSTVGLYYPGQAVSYVDPVNGVTNYFMASSQSGIITGATSGSPQLYPPPYAPNVCCYGAGCTCPPGQMATYYWEGCEVLGITSTCHTDWLTGGLKTGLLDQGHAGSSISMGGGTLITDPLLFFIVTNQIFNGDVIKMPNGDIYTMTALGSCTNGCYDPTTILGQTHWTKCSPTSAGSVPTGSTPSISNGQLYCVSGVTAPCEIPLDCGYCVDINGTPAPQWTEQGPCESADDGAIPLPTLLGNEWITDATALSDLVECPAALANIAYSKVQGGLATDVMDIRCAWLVIMIKHMLRNLNICFTLEDVQDVFAGFLDHVCPTCAVRRSLTPAEMGAITNMFTINNNLTFDF